MFGVNCRRSHDDRCAIPSSTHTANAVNPSATIADRIEFYHASMGSPALSTWCDAIDAGHIDAGHIAHRHIGLDHRFLPHTLASGWRG